MFVAIQFQNFGLFVFSCFVADSEIRRWNEVAACASHVWESPSADERRDISMEADGLDGEEIEEDELIAHRELGGRRRWRLRQ